MKRLSLRFEALSLLRADCIVSPRAVNHYGAIDSPKRKYIKKN